VTEGPGRTESQSHPRQASSLSGSAAEAWPLRSPGVLHFWEPCIINQSPT